MGLESTDLDWVDSGLMDVDWLDSGLAGPGAAAADRTSARAGLAPQPVGSR
jgi:hypothetical protein